MHCSSNEYSYLLTHDFRVGDSPFSQQPFIKVLSLCLLGSTEKPNTDMCLHAE